MGRSSGRAIDDLARELAAVPGVAAHLLVLVARHVELVRPVAVEVAQDRGVLEARRVGVDRLDLPGRLRVGARPQQPQPAAERRRHQLLLAVAVHVARGEEAREAVVDRRDHRAAGRRRAGVVAADLDLVHQLLRLVDVALDRDVELVGAVAVDVGDEDLLRVAVAEIRDHLALLARGGHIAHDVTRLRRARVEPVRLARRGVDLGLAVAVEIADLDLVHEDVRLAVELHGGEAVGGRPQHRDHALVVRGDRDGIDHRLVDAPADRLEGRDADGRIGVGIERQPALHGRFAEHEKAARVAVLERDVACRLDLGRVGEPLGEVHMEREREVGRAHAIEEAKPFRRGGFVEGGARLAGVRRGAQEKRVADLRAGELAVIGDRVGGRALVMPLRHFLGADRLGGAALPVGDARDRDRRLGGLRGSTEMGRGQRRVLEEAQRDPARVELGLDAVRAALGAMVSDDPVSQARVAGVEELAGDDAPLRPPFVAVGEDCRIARGAGHGVRGFGELVVPPQPLGPGERIGGVRLERPRHCIQKGARLLGVVGDGDARLDEVGVVGAGARGGAARSAPVLFEQHPLHAEPVVGLGEHAGELLQDLRLELLAEAVPPPSFADERGGVLVEPVGLEGEGERELAGRGRGPLRGEEGAHQRRGLAVIEQRLLGALADEGAGRPARILAQEARDALEADRGRGADRDPLHQGAHTRVRDRIAQAVAFSDVGLAVGLDRLLDEVEVEPRPPRRRDVGE